MGVELMAKLLLRYSLFFFFFKFNFKGFLRGLGPPRSAKSPRRITITLHARGTWAFSLLL